MSKPQEHAHKYIRVKMGTKGFMVFKCIRGGCKHYIRAELVIGYIAECWRCGQEMVMTQWHAQFKKPHCRECTRGHDSDPIILEEQAKLVRSIELLGPPQLFPHRGS